MKTAVSGTPTGIATRKQRVWPFDELWYLYVPSRYQTRLRSYYKLEI